MLIVAPRLLSDSPACFNLFPVRVELSQLWSTDEERGVKRVHGLLLVCQSDDDYFELPLSFELSHIISVKIKFV